MSETSNLTPDPLGLKGNPASSDHNETGVMLENHDALLSKLIDDAFYGRPLIAVTGVKGAGKTTLARRVAQQFANEAECIALKVSDFRNRDDFFQRLVSKLNPDSIEYTADSPLNTVVDYAGSLADQERLLVLIIDDAELLSGAFLETLYELIDEADEASLCCLLLGDPELKGAIERADPNGGIEDFIWFDLPKLDVPERVAESGQPIAAAVPELPEPPMIDIEKESDESFDELLDIMAQNDGAESPVERDAQVFEQQRSQLEEQQLEEPKGETEPEPEPEPEAQREPEPDTEPATESYGSSSQLFQLDESDDETTDAENSDEFDRDIDEWLEPDARPSIGGANFGAGEDLELDFDGNDSDLGTGANKTNYLAAAAVFARTMPMRLAAARNYWFAAGGLLLLVLAVVVFWRIPDEPHSDVIELTTPFASRTAESLSIQSTASREITRPIVPGPSIAERATVALIEPELNVPVQPPQATPMIAEPASVAIETTAPSNARAASEIDMRDEVEPISEARPEPRTANAVPAVLVPVVAAAPLQQSAPTGSAFERQLLAAPAQSFTLQILAASSEANVQAFVERNRSGLRQALGYYRSQRAGAPWFVVVYGEFATREEADATLNRLPEALSAAGPWARPITAAQAEIRAAQ